jgi:hypothetical protein
MTLSLVESVLDFTNAYASIRELLKGVIEERSLPSNWGETTSYLATLSKRRFDISTFLVLHGRHPPDSANSIISALVDSCHDALQRIDAHPLAFLDLEAIAFTVQQAGEPIRQAMNLYREELKTQTGTEDSERVVFDDPSQTVTLDGEPLTITDGKAYAIYQFIYNECQQHPGRPITNKKIQLKIKGLNGHNAVSDHLKSLPKALRDTIKTNTNGKSIRLPPREKIVPS